MNKTLLILVVIVLFCESSYAQMSRAELNSLNNYCDCEHVFISADSSEENIGNESVLKNGYQIAMVDKTIIRGSCWDFVNEVYKISGYDKSKEVVFRSKKNGPFAPGNLVKPGDWIYHINHEFNNGEHSAIFVCWKNFSKKIAVTLSYAGMNRNTTAKFGEYRLDQIYSIFRAQKNNKQKL